MDKTVNKKSSSIPYSAQVGVKKLKSFFTLEQEVPEEKEKPKEE